MATPQQYVHIPGAKLEYAWIGPAPADAPTLVFLHEGLGCLSMWREFPARLVDETGFGALVYSRAGYGQSDPAILPRPLRFMHDEAVVLGEVLQATGVHEAILIGHSDGGSIALIHAGSSPAIRIRALVLEAPHVFVEEHGLRSIARIGEQYRTTDLRERFARHHGGNVDIAFRGWNDVWLNPEFRSWNIEEFLPAISVPILILQGEDDEYGTWKQVEAIQRQAAGPVEVRKLESCGHSPHREQPDIARRFISDFIGRRVTSTLESP